MQEKLDPPHPVSWLKKTGQLWKLYGILGLGVPAIVLQVLVWFASDAPRRDYQSLLLLTLVAYVLCVWFPWITLAIRCPDCKRRIGWFAISTLPAQVFTYLRFRTDPTIAALSTMRSLISLIFMLIADRVVGLDRIMGLTR